MAKAATLRSAPTVQVEASRVPQLANVVAAALAVRGRLTEISPGSTLDVCILCTIDVAGLWKSRCA